MKKLIVISILLMAGVAWGGGNFDCNKMYPRNCPDEFYFQQCAEHNIPMDRCIKAMEEQRLDSKNHWNPKEPECRWEFKKIKVMPKCLKRITDIESTPMLINICQEFEPIEDAVNRDIGKYIEWEIIKFLPEHSVEIWLKRKVCE